MGSLPHLQGILVAAMPGLLHELRSQRILLRHEGLGLAEEGICRLGGAVHGLELGLHGLGATVRMPVLDSGPESIREAASRDLKGVQGCGKPELFQFAPSVVPEGESRLHGLEAFSPQVLPLGLERLLQARGGKSREDGRPCPTSAKACEHWSHRVGSSALLQSRSQGQWVRRWGGWVRGEGSWCLAKVPSDHLKQPSGLVGETRCHGGQPPPV